jgi:hypothetical protein
MTTPYEFGLKIGWFVKRADADDGEIAAEIAEMRRLSGQLNSAPGSNPNGNNRGTMAGGQLTTVNGQQQRLSPAQQAAVNTANKMRQENNRINAGAGGAGRGGPPVIPAQPRLALPGFKLPVNPGTRKPAPAFKQRLKPPAVPVLPNGPTSSPDFGKAVE